MHFVYEGSSHRPFAKGGQREALLGQKEPPRRLFKGLTFS